MKSGYVYILTNKKNGTLYTGVTNNVIRRIEEHKAKKVEGFSCKYECTIPVYYEYFEEISLAIAREKQIKWWTRAKKIALIESNNPEWNDLFEEIQERM